MHRQPNGPQKEDQYYPDDSDDDSKDPADSSPDVLGIAAEISYFANTSTKRMRKMKECIEEYNPERAKVAKGLHDLGVGVRAWDSAYHIVKRVCDVKEAVVAFCAYQEAKWAKYDAETQRKTRRCPVLTPEQWQVLEGMNEMLKLCVAQIRTFSEEKATMHWLLASLDDVHHRLTTWLGSDFLSSDLVSASPLDKGLYAAREKLAQHMHQYTANDVVLLGFVLNPWLDRLHGLHDILSQPYFDESIRERATEVELLLKQILKEPSEERDTEAGEQVVGELVVGSDGMLDDPSQGDKEESQEIQWLYEPGAVRPSSSGGGGTLGYWQARQEKYPTLAMLARSVLGASANATNLEPVIHEAWRTCETVCDWSLGQQKREDLPEETISKLVKLRAWLNAGFIRVR